METTIGGRGFRVIVSLKYMEYGVYEDFITTYLKPYSIYLGDYLAGAISL